MMMARGLWLVDSLLTASTRRTTNEQPYAQTPLFLQHILTHTTPSYTQPSSSATSFNALARHPGLPFSDTTDDVRLLVSV